MLTLASSRSPTLPPLFAPLTIELAIETTYNDAMDCLSCRSASPGPVALRSVALPTVSAAGNGEDRERAFGQQRRDEPADGGSEHAGRIVIDHNGNLHRLCGRRDR